VKPHSFHPEAEAEFFESLARYAAENEQLGRRYYHAIHGLIADVCRSPKVYPCFRGEVRRHFGKPFPYALIYVDEPQCVLVLAVAHFKRRPGYWLHRLKR